MPAPGTDWGALAMTVYRTKLCRFDPIGYNTNMQALPKELIHRILGFVPATFLSDPSSTMTNIHRLRGVCHLWRDIVHTTPSFFSNLHVDFKTRPEIVQECIQRSGQKDLTLYFSLGCEGESELPSYLLMLDLLDDIAPCIPRCKKLFFHASSAFSAALLFMLLNQLNAGSVPLMQFVADNNDVLHLPKIFTAGTSTVQHIVAERCALGVLPSSLTSLELVDTDASLELTATQLRTALSNALALQHLVAHGVSIQDDVGPRVLLPSLTALEISASKIEEVHILKIIELPELEQLILQLDEHELFDFVFKILSHGSKVKRLALAIMASSPGRMRSFFTTVPQLEWLNVSGSDEHMDATLIALLLSYPDLLQSIQRVDFGEKMADGLLASMFHALAERSPSVKVVSPVSDVENGHRQLQCMFLRGGAVVTEQQKVVNGDYWAD
ncbi:hypothetical protein R3P38DRAFT_3556308 [Favolaschia claudopus]|uniref:F-box domain-containing protein n=1 Tax=Favolaschia claudopus TaxID=2862362 RepID=A0AAW0B0J1_9AGAR